MLTRRLPIVPSTGTILLCLLLNYGSSQFCRPKASSIQTGQAPEAYIPNEHVGSLVSDYLQTVKAMASVVFLHDGHNGIIGDEVRRSLSEMGVKYEEYDIAVVDEQLVGLPIPELDVKKGQRCHFLILQTGGSLTDIQRIIIADDRITLFNISQAVISADATLPRPSFPVYITRWYETVGHFPQRPALWPPGNSMAYVGEWQGPGSLDVILRGPDPEINFRGKVFTITTAPHRPFQIWKNQTEQYEGISFNMLNTLAKKMNFSYKLLEPTPRKYGKVENGQWNGMMKLLVAGEVDFAVAAFSITEQRAKVVDFMWPFWEEPSTFLVAVYVDSAEGAVYKPFGITVWISLAASIPAMALLIWILFRADPIRFNYKPAITEFSLSMVNTFGAIWHQDSHWVPRTDASRVLCLHWWLFGVIITTLYSANLVAFLSIEKVAMPINSLEELVADTDYDVVLEKHTALEQLLLDSGDNSPLYQSIWKKIVNGKAYNKYADLEPRDVVSKAETQDIVFMEELTVAQEYAAEFCKLRVSDARFFKANLAFATRKGFPYTDLFNRKIMQLKEGGFIANWRDKYAIHGSCADIKTEVTSRQITMINTTTVWNLLGLGIAVAAGILFIEMTVKSALFRGRVSPCC